MTETKQIKKTPLYDKHIEAGGKMIDFAGFKLPIQYEGIIAEHNTVREKAGIFDLTHMGEIQVRGEDAVHFVNHVITNDLESIEPGGVIYTAICKDNGGVLDDALVYRMEDKVMMVVNAVNLEKIYRWLLKNEWENARVLDLSDKIALIAVQGPEAEKIVQGVTPMDLSEMKFSQFKEGKILDAVGIISRTGYTGEDGFEIYIGNDDAPAVWDQLMLEGEPYGMKPIGLGARDTLRLEAKLCLYGNELSEEINPFEAGVKWTVKLDKEHFIGRKALLKVKEDKPQRKLIGFEMLKPGVPRTGYKVYNKDEEEIGFVTSGTHSPTLKKAIGLAIVRRKTAKRGDEILVGIRKRKVPAKVVKTPFVKGSVKSGK